MQNKFDGVFFDFDGTVADTSKGIYRSVDYAADALGKPRLDDVNKRYFIGPPIFDSFKFKFNLSDEDAAFAVAKYRECYSSGAMFCLDLYEGIYELIEELNKAGICVAICSSKPEKYIGKIIEHFKMDKMIDLLSCPEIDLKGKSKQEMIDNASEILKLDKSRILMVGDRMFDIEGAVKSGVHSCGAAYGYGSEEELINAGAEKIVYSVKELRDYIF